jgi:hypothetical protein
MSRTYTDYGREEHERIFNGGVSIVVAEIEKNQKAAWRDEEKRQAAVEA